MIEPLISIVIPTRNRQKYCIAAIENILSYDYPNFELCIRDNSDNDDVNSYIRTRVADPRIKYEYISERLNSVINMDAAIGLASGKYVVMIGDDDTILPEIFNVAQFADKEGIDSVCSLQTVSYFWPGAYPGTDSGLLCLSEPFRSKVIDWSVTEKLDHLFAHGITRFLEYKLPKVYHGLILRQRLLEVKKKTGHFFGGLSPDVYSTMALSLIVDNHVIVEKAITIAGACNMSSTSQNVNNGHRGSLDDAPHFRFRGPYIWDNYVPAYYSVDTIWAESALRAIREMNSANLLKKYNFSYLAIFSILNTRSIFKYAVDKTFSKENYFIKNDRFIYLKCIKALCSILWGYSLRSIKRKTNNEVRHYNISNISEAVNHVNNQ